MDIAEANVSLMEMEIANLLEVVKAVEWVHNYEYGKVCAWCGYDKDKGHALNCKRQEVLRKVEGNENTCE
jgi:hypothetical protein